MPESAGLEAALEQTGDQVADALRAAAAVIRDLKKGQRAARDGQVRDLRRALASASELAGQLATVTAAAQSALTCDEQAELSSGTYAQELLAAAAGRGLTMVADGDRLLCYPSIIRLLPGDAAIEIDRRREKRLRPSAVVDRLGAVQNQPPRFRPEPFLESLLDAYEHVVASRARAADAVVPLVEVWRLLTLLPGQSREYTQPEFARDLYLLDQSGATVTKSGRALRWHASTGTRGSGVLSTVARSGQQQRYWGVSFAGGA